ncbi:hypothetical protein KIPB_002653, partial [Kipferlia bialata]
RDTLSLDGIRLNHGMALPILDAGLPGLMEGERCLLYGGMESVLPKAGTVPALRHLYPLLHTLLSAKDRLCTFIVLDVTLYRWTHIEHDYPSTGHSELTFTALAVAKHKKAGKTGPLPPIPLCGPVLVVVPGRPDAVARWLEGIRDQCPSVPCVAYAGSKMTLTRVREALFFRKEHLDIRTLTKSTGMAGQRLVKNKTTKDLYARMRNSQVQMRVSVVVSTLQHCRTDIGLMCSIPWQSIIVEETPSIQAKNMALLSELAPIPARHRVIACRAPYVPNNLSATALAMFLLGIKRDRLEASLGLAPNTLAKKNSEPIPKLLQMVHMLHVDVSRKLLFPEFAAYLETVFPPLPSVPQSPAPPGMCNANTSTPTDKLLSCAALSLKRGDRGRERDRGFMETDGDGRDTPADPSNAEEHLYTRPISAIMTPTEGRGQTGVEDGNGASHTSSVYVLPVELKADRWMALGSILHREAVAEALTGYRSFAQNSRVYRHLNKALTDCLTAVATEQVLGTTVLAPSRRYLITKLLEEIRSDMALVVVAPQRMMACVSAFLSSLPVPAVPLPLVMPAGQASMRRLFLASEADMVRAHALNKHLKDTPSPTLLAFPHCIARTIGAVVCVCPTPHAIVEHVAPCSDAVFYIACPGTPESALLSAPVRDRTDSLVTAALSRWCARTPRPKPGRPARRIAATWANLDVDFLDHTPSALPIPHCLASGAHEALIGPGSWSLLTEPNIRSLSAVQLTESELKDPRTVLKERVMRHMRPGRSGHRQPSILLSLVGDPRLNIKYTPVTLQSAPAPRMTVTPVVRGPGYAFERCLSECGTPFAFSRLQKRKEHTSGVWVSLNDCSPLNVLRAAAAEEAVVGEHLWTRESVRAVLHSRGGFDPDDEEEGDAPTPAPTSGRERAGDTGDSDCEGVEGDCDSGDEDEASYIGTGIGQACARDPVRVLEHCCPLQLFERHPDVFRRALADSNKDRARSLVRGMYASNCVSGLVSAFGEVALGGVSNETKTVPKKLKHKSTSLFWRRLYSRAGLGCDTVGNVYMGRKGSGSKRMWRNSLVGPSFEVDHLVPSDGESSDDVSIVEESRPPRSIKVEQGDREPVERPRPSVTVSPVPEPSSVSVSVSSTPARGRATSKEAASRTGRGQATPTGTKASKAAKPVKVKPQRDSLSLPIPSPQKPKVVTVSTSDEALLKAGGWLGASADHNLVCSQPDLLRFPSLVLLDTSDLENHFLGKPTQKVAMDAFVNAGNGQYLGNVGDIRRRKDSIRTPVQFKGAGDEAITVFNGLVHQCGELSPHHVMTWETSPLLYRSFSDLPPFTQGTVNPREVKAEPVLDSAAVSAQLSALWAELCQVGSAKQRTALLAILIRYGIAGGVTPEQVFKPVLEKCSSHYQLGKLKTVSILKGLSLQVELIRLHAKYFLKWNDNPPGIPRVPHPKAGDPSSLSSIDPTVPSRDEYNISPADSADRLLLMRLARCKYLALHKSDTVTDKDGSRDMVIPPLATQAERAFYSTAAIVDSLFQNLAGQDPHMSIAHADMLKRFYIWEGHLTALHTVYQATTKAKLVVMRAFGTDFRALAALSNEMQLVVRSVIQEAMNGWSHSHDLRLIEGLIKHGYSRWQDIAKDTSVGIAEATKGQVQNPSSLMVQLTQRITGETASSSTSGPPLQPMSLQAVQQLCAPSAQTIKDNALFCLEQNGRIPVPESGTLQSRTSGFLKTRVVLLELALRTERVLLCDPSNTRMRDILVHKNRNRDADSTDKDFIHQHKVYLAEVPNQTAKTYNEIEAHMAALLRRSTQPTPTPEAAAQRERDRLDLQDMGARVKDMRLCDYMRLDVSARVAARRAAVAAANPAQDRTPAATARSVRGADPASRSQSVSMGQRPLSAVGTGEGGTGHEAARDKGETSDITTWTDDKLSMWRQQILEQMRQCDPQCPSSLSTHCTMPPPRQMSESANPRHFRQEVSALKRELAALKTESMASDSRHRHMTVSLNHQLQALQKQNHDFQETAEHLQSVIANLRSRLRETRNVAAAAKARADTAESLAERRRLALQGEKNNESVRNQAHGRYEQVLASQLKKVTTEKKALAQECSSMSTECSQLRAALKVLGLL